MHNFRFLSITVLAAATVGFGQSSAALQDHPSEVVLTYRLDLKLPPIKSFAATTYEQRLERELASGMPRHLAEQNAKIQTEYYKKVAKDGVTQTRFIKALVFSDGVSCLATPSGAATEPNFESKQCSLETLTESAYGFFHGSQADVPRLAGGTIGSVNLKGTSTEGKPPNHWLPHAFGSQFSLCLIGYKGLDELIQKSEIVSDDAQAIELKNRNQTCTIIKKQGVPFGSVKWTIPGSASPPSLDLTVNRWVRVANRMVAEDFSIIETGEGGVRGLQRHYSLVDKAESKVPTKRPFEIWPNPTFVVDSRSTPARNYWMRGKLLSVEETAKHPVPGKPAKPQPEDRRPQLVIFASLAALFFAGWGIILWKNRAHSKGG